MNQQTRDYVESGKLLLLTGATHVDTVQQVFLIDPLQVYTWCSPRPALINARHLYFTYTGENYEEKAEMALSGVEEDLHGNELDLDGIVFDQLTNFGTITATDECTADYEDEDEDEEDYAWDEAFKDFRSNHRI